MRSATLVLAQFVGLGDRLGCLAEGKSASMVLLRATRSTTCATRARSRPSYSEAGTSTVRLSTVFWTRQESWPRARCEGLPAALGEVKTRLLAFPRETG